PARLGGLRCGGAPHEGEGAQAQNTDYGCRLAHRHSLNAVRYGSALRLRGPQVRGVSRPGGGLLGLPDALAEVLVGDLAIAHGARRPNLLVLVAVAALR